MLLDRNAARVEHHGGLVAVLVQVQPQPQAVTVPGVEHTLELDTTRGTRREEKGNSFWDLSQLFILAVISKMP